MIRRMTRREAMFMFDKGHGFILEKDGRAIGSVGVQIGDDRIWVHSLQCEGDTHGASMLFQAVINLSRMQDKPIDAHLAKDSPLLKLVNSGRIKVTEERLDGYMVRMETR